MPKKFTGENTKAVAARERKSVTQNTAITIPPTEDEYSEDTNKKVLRKLQKKEQVLQKKQDQLQRKVENKTILDAEVKAIKSNKVTSKPKITRDQIEKKSAWNRVKTSKAPERAPIEQNLNRSATAGESARSVDQALAILSDGKTDTDKHPEKRCKAAYSAFEAKRKQELKASDPTLRLSQMKEMIFKEWKTHPDNPLRRA